MKIKRRFPNCFTGFETTEHEVNSYEELISVDWLKDIIEYLNSGGDDYVDLEYSLSSYDEPDFLMAVNKKTFWCVAYIYGDPKELGLKEWKHGTT